MNRMVRFDAPPRGHSVIVVELSLLVYFRVADNVLSIHELNWKKKEKNTKTLLRVCVCVCVHRVHMCVCLFVRSWPCVTVKEGGKKLGKKIEKGAAIYEGKQSDYADRSISRSHCPNGVSCNTKSTTRPNYIRLAAVVLDCWPRPSTLPSTNRWMTATSKARNKLLRCTRVCIPSNESYPNVATHLEICPLRSRVCCLELYAYGFPLKQDSLQVLPSDTPNYSLTLSLSLFLSFSRLVSRARHHHRRISITSSSIRFDSIRFDGKE